MNGLEYIESRSIPEPNSGCWLWLGCVDPKGYGRISRRTFGETLAHRYAFISAGFKADGVLVCHRCDVPSCVNPDHLFSGTHVDNTTDMIKKGRKNPALGEAVGASKMTEDDVFWLRKHVVLGDPEFGVRPLAKVLGVGRTAVSNAFHRRAWKHLK